MMGTQNSERSLFSYSVNLDKRVRPDHPLRRFSALLDLSWVRQAVACCYGKKGNVSVDPVVLVKMMLLLFLDNIASERELMAVIAERLDYLWFLGYGLDDEIPNHSVLSKARARWGKELFEEIFTRTVLQCVQAGLVENERLHVDSSLIKANAAKASARDTSPELLQALRVAYQHEENKLEERDDKAVNARRFSPTDPEATLARSGGGKPSDFSYKAHRTVDDTEGVITAVKTTTGAEGDSRQLPELLAQHEQNTGTKPKIAVGDQHYGSAENYRLCQMQGITTHLKTSRSDLEAKGIFTHDKFEYEEAFDRFKCPAGHYLYPYNVYRRVQMLIYRIERVEFCTQCPLKEQCTRAKTGRMVSRPLFFDLVAAAKAQAQSPEAWVSYRRRSHKMEGSFADASNNHGFKRARWRGLWKVQIQNWLIAAVQNLRILMKKGRSGNEGVSSLWTTTFRTFQRLIERLGTFCRPHGRLIYPQATL
jgi:transposase